SALSPVSAADQALDASLRADLGAPDVRWLVAIDAATPDDALRASELVSAQLDKLVGEGAIAGFDSPSHYLPSAGTQQQRLAALPPRDELSARLAAATRELPLRADKLAPFLDDVEQVRRNPPATRADMQGSSLAQAVDAMLMRQAGHWRALLPLRAMTEGPMAERIDAGRLRAALQASGVAGATFIDLKRESDAMYAGYLHEAILLALGGAAAIVLLLAVALRSPGRLLRVIAPLALAVLLVTAALALAGERLTLLHLVGMLLVAAVGSNYALFFDGLRGSSGEDSERTLASLVLANLTAVIGFGVLGFSSVPVLHAIGIVVGPGALLALLLSAMMNGDAVARGEHAA
ncbi:MAG: hypothetical protein HGA47_14115, partial [Zoogloea sp.]|nr:hypothetical protein [Zoogloea sp.]